MRLVVTAAAAAIGFFIGGPTLAFQAAAFTYGVTGFLDPDKRIRGPKLDDLKAPQATYGAVIPYIEGVWRTAGNVIYASDKREIANTESQGKGGPGVKATTYTYEIDIGYELSINPLGAMLEVRSNGKLIWTINPDSDGESFLASGGALINADGSIEGGSNEHWRAIRFQPGSDTQLPDPMYEAAVGVGNAPAYRGRATVWIEGLNLGGSGQVPVLNFTVASEASTGTQTDQMATYLQDRDYIGGIPAMRKDGFYAITGGEHDGTQLLTVILYQVDPTGNASSIAVFPAPSGFESSQPAFRTGVGNSDQSCIVVQSGSGSEFCVVEFDNSQSVYYVMFHPGAVVFSRVGNTILAATRTPRPVPNVGTNYVARYVQGAQNPAALALLSLNGITSLAQGNGHAYVLGDAGELLQLDLNSLTLQATMTPPVANSTPQTTSIVCDEAGTLFFASGSSLGSTPADVYSWDGSTWTLVYADVGVSSDTGLLANVYNDCYTAGPDTFFTQVWSNSSTPALARFFFVRAVATANLPLLSDVVERLSIRTGQLEAGDLDLTALDSDVVRGMAISQVGPTRNALEMLMTGYLFEWQEGEKLVAVLRGAAPVLTIPYEHLGAGNGSSTEPLPRKRVNDPEVPAVVTVKFANTLNDFQNGAETADRLTTESTAVALIELALAFEPQEAKRLAEANTMDLQVAELQIGPVSIPRAYPQLQAGDVILLEDPDESTFRCRIIRMTVGQGVSTMELVLDDATAINSTAATDSDYSAVTLVRALASTIFVPMDIPILRDADDGPGFYGAFSAIGRWPGAELDVSIDGTSYAKVLEVTDRAVLGLARSVLGDFTGGRVFDEFNSLVVDVGDGTLSSVSRDTLLESDQNALLVGAEVIQFRDVTVDSDGIYTLTGFLRGRRGTEWAMAGHGADERVVLLQTSGIRHIEDQQADIGISRFWKAVTFGKSRASAPAITFADTGVALKPFSPVDARADKARSGDITLSWLRRTRLSTSFMGTGSVVPLGEAVELYKVEVYSDNTYTSIVRTFNPTVHEVVYTAAMQETDFGSFPMTLYLRIYQVSASVGLGYPLEVAIGLADVETFAPVTSNQRVIVQVSSGDNWLVTRHGNSSVHGQAIGLYTSDGSDDVLRLVQIASASHLAQPYLNDLQIFASDDATGAFVLLLRGQGNTSGLRKLIAGVLPDQVEQVVPSFMPANEPMGLWWTGSEFRALLVDKTVWSSPDGFTWTSEGSATGVPTRSSDVEGAYIVQVGSSLSMKFSTVSVHFCADTDGLVWTAATGDLATLPTATYDDFFGLMGIETNGSLGVIFAIGRKVGDFRNYGLLFTTTDGETWGTEFEDETATSYSTHDPRINGGIHEFNGDFLVDLWPIAGGSTTDSILPIATLTGGAEATFAYYESVFGKGADAGVLATGRYATGVGLSAVGIPYFTSDLDDSTILTWDDDT